MSKFEHGSDRNKIFVDDIYPAVSMDIYPGEDVWKKRERGHTKRE